VSDRDIIITWPKTEPLGSYLMALEVAAERGEVINYRVPSPPKLEPERCYVVYDGEVIGWNEVLSVERRGGEEVLDPRTGNYWPSGWYIVRDPVWHPLRTPLPCRGFQGFRYTERL
jgi:hypothetical protein